MPVVLIVEDDVFLRVQVTRMLHRLPNVEVVEAGTVRESIELAEGLPLDLVISDVQLPDGSALQLFPHLVRDGTRIPTVLVTGYPEALAGKLPADIKLLEKPVRMSELRDCVMQALDCQPTASPFAISDYLQLAGLGRHSVQLEVSQDGDPVGLLVIRDGRPWTALDELGEGLEVLLRMMVTPNLSFTASAPAALEERRTLDGTCEQLLLEAARLLDERRSGRADLKARTGTKPWLVSTRPPAPGRTSSSALPVLPAPAPLPPAPPPPPPVPAPVLARGSSRETPPVVTRATSRELPRVPFPARDAPRPGAPPASPNGRGSDAPDRASPGDGQSREFDRLYEEGITALLEKRYAEAFQLFMRAKQFKSTPTLEANLQRLRSMGHA